MSEDDKKGAVSLISNLVLLGTAGWGLKTCIDHPFISAGFAIFAVRGLVGVISFFGYQNQTLRSAFDFEKNLGRIDHASYNVSYPLFSMEVMNVTQFQPENIKFCLLLFPVLELLFNIETVVLHASHGVCAISVIICDFQQCHWYYILSLLGFTVEKSVDSKMSESTRVIVMAATSALYAALINGSVASLLLDDS